jgi:hypothetical protein
MYCKQGKADALGPSIVSLNTKKKILLLLLLLHVLQTRKSRGPQTDLRPIHYTTYCKQGKADSAKVVVS